MEYLLSSLLLIVFSVVIYRIITKPSAKDGKRPYPPGPRELPIVGSLFELGDKPHKALAALAKTYGPIMKLQLGQITTIVISSSAAAKEIFHTHDRLFPFRPIPAAATAFNHSDYGMPWLPIDSLWRNLRKISNNHLFSVKSLDANMNLRHKKVQDLVNDVQKHVESGEAIDIGRAAFTTSLNLLSTTFFSVDLADSSTSDTAKELRDTVWNLMEEAGKPNLADFFPFLQKFDPQGVRKRATVHIGKFMNLFDRIVSQRLRLREEARRAGSPRDDDNNDMLDSLINMMSNTEFQLDKNQIEHLLLDLLLGGIETTSAALEWAMAELIKNPEIMSKARAELDQVIGKGNQVKESDIAHLPYLQAIVKETMRLHPSIALLHRVAGEEGEIYGYTVPKDAQIFINAWAIGRDPNVWENPTKFTPERFLGSSVDYRSVNCEFLPFGGGRRICPGLPLGSRMLHLILGSLINSFVWKLEKGVSPETMNMDDKFGFSMQMAQPLHAIPCSL